MAADSKKNFRYEESIDFYNQNATFNASLDYDGEVEVVGHKFLPSKILFHTDNIAYLEDYEDWKADLKIDKMEKAKSILEIHSNKGRVADLISAIKNKRTIPFIGAGMSVPSGLPGWSKFLNNCAENAGVDSNTLNELLIAGKYEDGADLIISKMSEDWFNQQFRYSFNVRDKNVCGPIELLPDLSKHGVVTTNFDNALETIYSAKNSGFEHIFYGPEAEVLKIFSSGSHALLKIHGDLHRSSKRVLTKPEYDEVYGVNDIDFSKILPQFISKLCSSYCILFLGCSLTSDRTLSVLNKMKADAQNRLHHPEHLAFIAMPKTDAERIEREKFLISNMIFPIWYPDQDHDYVECLLTYVLEQAR